jgi:hypothetical protein
MAVRSSAYQSPGGLTTALLILGGVDLVLSLANIIFAGASLAALRRMNIESQNLAIGGTGLILLGQILLRLAMMSVRARWTYRLVCNAALFQRLPVTPLWAWAGFFVPVVSLWLPASLMMALSCTGTRQNRWLNPLCLIWAMARWLTCLSGAAMVFMGLVTLAVYREVVEKHPHDVTELMLRLFLALAIAGVASAGLGILLTAWIARRQLTPEQLHHAEVF